MSGFQYLDLPADQALAIKSATERIRLRLKRISDSEIENEQDSLMVEKLLQERENINFRDNEKDLQEVL